MESLTYLFICVYYWKISDNWKLLQTPNILSMIIGLIFMCYMPESPRFLVSIKQFKKARKVFKWIGKMNGLSKEEVDKALRGVTFEGEEKQGEIQVPDMVEETDQKPDVNLRK